MIREKPKYLKPLEHLFEQCGISTSVHHCNGNPHLISTSKYEMDHWECVLQKGKEKIVLYYSTGLGHRQGRKESFYKGHIYAYEPGYPKAPPAGEILWAWLQDISYIEQYSDWTEWGEELGYGLRDAQKLQKSWLHLIETKMNLQQLFGGIRYAALASLFDMYRDEG